VFIVRLNLLLVVVPLCAHLEGRTWTTTSGSKSEGELFEVVGDRIGLRIRGREYHFSIGRFIPADQAYVKQWMQTPRCGACSGALGTRSVKAGKASYHTACFRCMVTRRNFGPGDRFRKDDWGGMVHVDHFSATGVCGTCSRIFPKRNAIKEQFFADGRITCGPCLKDGIFKLDLLHQVDKRIWPSLTEAGFDKPRGELELLLVDRGTLTREASKINASGNLRGLTLTKYKVVKGGNNPRTTFNHRIFVLYGLPYVECVSVLAHEHAHVWLNERFIEAPLPVTEGFCNLASYLVLQREKSKLSSILLENMQNSESPVYGAGYRMMRQKLGQAGWPALLREMKGKASPP
tara:strand:- start:403 stop:1446 length:1044 start_codon:yes stop_codon:yes gene_type:complete